MASQRQARSRSRADRSRPGRARPPVRQNVPRGVVLDPVELQQRLGNRGTQAFLAENAFTSPDPPVISEPETEVTPQTLATPLSATADSQQTAVSPTTSEIIQNPVPAEVVQLHESEATSVEPIQKVADTGIIDGTTDFENSTATTSSPTEDQEQDSETQASSQTASTSSTAPTQIPVESSSNAQQTDILNVTDVTEPSAASAEEESGAQEVAAAPSPREAIAPAISAVHNRATGEQQHRSPNVPVASAEAAGQDPQTEQTRMAAQQTVTNLDAETENTEEVKREQFKSKLRKAIEDATPEPQTEAQANRVINNGAGNASNTISEELATQRDAAAGPLQSAASPGSEVAPSTLPAPPETDLEPEPIGEAPLPVSAASVVPQPSLPLDCSSDRDSTEQIKEENNVTEEQMATSNEPSFGSALETRATAEENEATVETRYRESESNMRTQSQGRGQQALAQGLTEMHSGRSTQIGLVIGQQNDTMSKNATERLRITTTINGIKDKTQTDVTKILDDMVTGATKKFEDGLKLAEKVYKDTFEDAKGGVGTWLTTWGDDWEDLIKGALATARDEYFNQVDIAIDDVADLVEKKLAEAKQRVTDGLTEVQKFVDELDDSVKQFGEDALSTVTADFDAMRSEIDERRDGLINNLAQQYKDSYERMNAMEEQLRAENKSLWQRVYDATVGVIQQIIAFKDMLLGVLARAAAVVESIILDPIGFLGNLISGIKAGLDLFFGNIVEHLKQGLMGWLFGALEGAGIQIPDSFDFKGILSLIMQVLGLTYDNIRKRAVNILGEEMVSRLEQVAEIFKVLFTEGPAGLWRMLMEQLSGIKDMLMEEIQGFVISEIIEAGVKWIIGLLNPAAAFIKACMMIYDIIIFFIERGSQIIELVNAIINSLAAIVSGNIQAMAQAVEGALARILPIAISFLAALVGLGGISGKIREIIEKIQEPINTAIDWVIGKAVQLARAAGDLFSGGGKKNEEETPETDDPEHDAQVTVALDGVSQKVRAEDPDGELQDNEASSIESYARLEYPIFTSVQVFQESGNWYFEYTASKGKKIQIAEVEELVELASKVRYRGLLIELPAGRFVLRNEVVEWVRLHQETILRGNPTPTQEVSLEGNLGTAKEEGEAAFREVAGALTLAQLEDVEDVALGREAEREIYPEGNRLRGDPDADIIATTNRGTRLLGEGKGLANVPHALEQFRGVTERLLARNISVDGYYIFKPQGNLTSPGLSISNGVLYDQDGLVLIDGKPVYVIDVLPQGEMASFLNEL